MIKAGTTMVESVAERLTCRHVKREINGTNPGRGASLFELGIGICEFQDFFVFRKKIAIAFFN